MNELRTASNYTALICPINLQLILPFTRFVGKIGIVLSYSDSFNERRLILKLLLMEAK